MNILTDINPGIVSVFAGLMIGAFVLILIGPRIAKLIGNLWNNAQGTSAPQPPVVLPAPRPTLTGLSWVIAATHRSVSQLIGLIMSGASLIAIILSVICAVVGIAIISYQQYGNMVLSLVAAAATFILALLIENTSINALKTIRLANEEIAQAEKAHYVQIVKQMEDQFEEDVRDFAQVNQQTLTKEEVQSMQRAASLKRQARQQFEKKRRGLMREQTRTARHNRRASIPFAVVGILFSATAGGLFWHTLLASLALWLNITVGTMFALAVSVTFVQSELLKRIKDDAIAEALRSGEMQNVMLKQQSEEMVLEMVVDTMAAVKQDPNTLIEMGTGIKEELKTTIRTLTKQTTSRLVEDTESHGEIIPNEVSQTTPEVEQKASTKREKKEPEWLAQMEQSVIPLRHPRLRQKLDSLRSAGRVTISIVSLMDALNCSKKFIQYRIKSGALQVATHNNNLIRISSVIDWLQTADIPMKEAAPSEKTHEAAEISNDHSPSQSPPADVQLNQNDSIPEDADGDWKEKLSITLEAIRTNPTITEEELAAKLGMKASGIVRFWKVKAQEMLEQQSSERMHNLLTRASTPRYDGTESSSTIIPQNGHVG